MRGCISTSVCSQRSLPHCSPAHCLPWASGMPARTRIELRLQVRVVRDMQQHRHVDSAAAAVGPRFPLRRRCPCLLAARQLPALGWPRARRPPAPLGGAAGARFVARRRGLARRRGRYGRVLRPRCRCLALLLHRAAAAGRPDWLARPPAQPRRQLRALACFAPRAGIACCLRRAIEAAAARLVSRGPGRRGVAP